MNGLAKHPNAYIGEDPNTEIEHVPVQIGLHEYDNAQVVEVWVLEGIRIMLFSNSLNPEGPLQHYLNEHPQSQKSDCKGDDGFSSEQG